MELIAPILQAIAALLGALFAFTALFVLKPQITLALGRLRKGEILGQNFELDEELVKLNVSATAAERGVQLETTTGHFLVGGSATASANQEEKFDATIKSILQQATNAPKIALMTLGAELEKQALHALATRGLLRGRPVAPVSQALSELSQYGFPPNLLGSLQLFTDVRNKIVRGRHLHQTNPRCKGRHP